MRRGRAIIIEIDIDGERWTKDFDSELSALMSHIEASVRLWDETGWQPKQLIGTDRQPTAVMRLEYNWPIEALPPVPQPAEPDTSDIPEVGKEFFDKAKLVEPVPQPTLRRTRPQRRPPGVPPRSKR